MDLIKLPTRQYLASFHNIRNYHQKNNVFQKQDQAIEYSTRLSGVPVFGVQYQPGSTSRKYHVIGYDSLWETVCKKNPLQLCYHEILFGPVNMYMDMEFNRALNPDICSDEKVVSRVIQAVRDTFSRCLGIVPTEEDFYCTSACSSTKFSYHIVINLVTGKKCMFYDPETCKSMALEIIHTGLSDKKYWFYQRDQDGPRDEELPKGISVFAENPTKDRFSSKGINTSLAYVKKEELSYDSDTEISAESKKKKKKINCMAVSSVIDTQPYSSLKSMRTTYSTKIEDSLYRPLMPHSLGTRIPREPPGIEERDSWGKQKFLRMLIGYVSPMDKVWYIITSTYDTEEEKYVFTKNKLINAEEIDVKQEQAENTTVSSNRSQDKDLVFGGILKDWCTKKRSNNGGNLHNNKKEEFRSYSHLYPDPPPESAKVLSLEYVDRILKFGTSSSQKTMFDSKQQCILFSTISTFCPFAKEELGRPHKSNHVYVKIHILSGVAVILCHKCLGKSEILKVPYFLMKHLRKQSAMADKNMGVVDPELGGTITMLNKSKDIK